ncbi:MAG TPA: methyltransferase [Bacteroidia bacterium]
MSNSIFEFKEFKVRQDKCLMKIGTDSVLLGAWANPTKAKNILDIGTGTGIIALMLAQRSTAKIDVVDIDADACNQANENFMRSKWSDRFEVHHYPLQQFISKKKYDLIISNPPYFPCPNTHEEQPGSQVRFTHKLSFAQLAESVVELLAPNGIFYVIFPIHEGACFTNEAEKRGLFLSDYLWVKTTARKKFPKRILMKFDRAPQPVNEGNVLIIQRDDDYTEEYKQLTKDYYLKF